MKLRLALVLNLTFACSAETSYKSQPHTQEGSTSTPIAAPKESSSETPVTKDAIPSENPSPKPVPAPATTPLSSKGSGGATGLIEVPFQDSTGLASSYKINAPADAAQKIYGLHIHLHGDGGGGYRDFPNKELRSDLIGVTIKAPNPNLQWGRAAGKQHALYVNELIQNELLKKYNVDLAKIYFSSVSGGAYFLTGSFIPEYGQLYQSAAMILCGGEPPRLAFADPKTLSKFRLHFELTAGERQDISSSVQATVAAYKTAAIAAGVAADQQQKLQTLNVQGAGGHCVFDGVSYTSGIQQAIDTKFKSILPQ